MKIPKDYPAWKTLWQEYGQQFTKSYTNHSSSFVPYLLPEEAIRLNGRTVLRWLIQRYGEQDVRNCMTPDFTYPSPVFHQQHPGWLRQTNMVGINVRTLRSFWNVVKYAFTLPAHQNAIHLLPIWEPGVVGSLYGMAGWNINTEFFSSEFFELFPELDTTSKQLKAVVNLLHLLGKTVGMDVIPHTDRYSEIVLANPSYFEWMRRQEDQIVDHRADLHEEVQEVIFDWLNTEGPAISSLEVPPEPDTFFTDQIPEKLRRLVLFGYHDQLHERNQRRGKLINHLLQYGFEPVPATMAPPYRGLEVDPESKSVDAAGRSWYDYRIKEPQEMSRVFGPLTRYKLYDRLNDNQHWEIDFDRPRKKVWDYVCRKYGEMQQAFSFDFMRGDMSHVQMRPEGVPAYSMPFYDLHREVKEHIRKEAPYFGYFAETFLAPEGTMSYGNELDHLELSDADVTLGDLQSIVVGTHYFSQSFRWYLDLLQYRKTAPSFTLMTADKDDPRFDKFYLKGNEARLFIATFLTDMPSYMGLGFECRDPHPEPAPNEHYTKLYVFQIEDGPKATRTPYQFGKNVELFHRLQQIHTAAEQILPRIKQQPVQWILPPDAIGHHQVIAWTHQPGSRMGFCGEYEYGNS
jgi:hypothetical protein